MNQNYTEEELEKIDNITYSNISARPRTNSILKLIKTNNKNIICEYYIIKNSEDKKLIDTLELVKTIEIEHKIWYKIINKLLKIIYMNNYFWNNNYSVGEYPVKDGEKWKIIIKSKNEEYIEINCDLNTPQEFGDILSTFIGIYYKKIKE